MSPPPINLKTHPSLRKRSKQDTSHPSGSSQIDDDLQFSCAVKLLVQMIVPQYRNSYIRLTAVIEEMILS